jgi:hypothetical protein
LTGNVFWLSLSSLTALLMSVGLQVVFTTCRTTREVLQKYLTE